MEDQEQKRFEYIVGILKIWCLDDSYARIYHSGEESTVYGYSQAQQYVEFLTYLQYNELKTLYTSMSMVKNNE